jgi:hypothetical protein
MALPKIRSREVREDQFIVDAVRTFLRLKHKHSMREEEDEIFSRLVPRIEQARHSGESIDLGRFLEDSWDEMKRLALESNA